MTQTLNELRAQNGTQDDDAVAHAGVMGMKWGVRKDRKGGSSSSGSDSESSKPKGGGGSDSDSGGGSSKPKHNPIDNINNKNSSSKASTQNRNHLSTLSDKDLKDAIARVKMEQEFMQLTKPPPTKLQKGAKIVGEILLTAGKQHAQAYVSKELGNLIAGLDATAKGKAADAKDAKKEAPAEKPKVKPKTAFTPSSAPKSSGANNAGTRPPTQEFKFKNKTKTPKAKKSSAGNQSNVSRPSAEDIRRYKERQAGGGRPSSQLGIGR